MDQGWEAIAAGVAAFVGAVASGWYTGRSARLGAQKAAEAVLRQVVDQGAIEHGHWLRGQRQTAYVAFVAEWDRSVAHSDRQRGRAFFESGTSSRRRAANSAEIRAQVEQAMDSVREPYERVMVLGPDNVDEAAQNMMAALSDMRTVAMVLSGHRDFEEENSSFPSGTGRAASAVTAKVHRVARPRPRLSSIAGRAGFSSPSGD